MKLVDGFLIDTNLNLPEGMYGELVHLDLQIAMLNPALRRRLETFSIRQFRQLLPPVTAVGRWQSQISSADISISFSDSFVALLILDSVGLLLCSTACTIDHRPLNIQNTKFSLELNKGSRLYRKFRLVIEGEDEKSSVLTKYYNSNTLFFRVSVLR